MRHLTNDYTRVSTILSQADYSPSPGTGVGRSPVTNLQVDRLGLPWIPSPTIDEPTTGGGDIEIYTSASGATSVISWTWVNQLQDPTDAAAGNLAAMQVAIRAAHADLAAVDVTRSTATGKITIDLNDPGETFNLLWSNTVGTIATGNALGFGASDLTGADTYTAATEKRYNWARVVWDLGSAQDVGVVALVGHNLALTDVIEIYSHTSDLGATNAAWAATGTAFGTFTVNNEYADNPIIAITAGTPPNARYIAVFIKTVAARTDDDLRIGFMALNEEWQDYRQAVTDYGIRPEWQSQTNDPTAVGRTPSQVQQISTDLRMAVHDWSSTEILAMWKRITATLRREPTVWYLGSVGTGCLEGDRCTFGKVDAETWSPNYRSADIGSTEFTVVGQPRGWA